MSTTEKELSELEQKVKDLFKNNKDLCVIVLRKDTTVEEFMKQLNL